ncbi:CopL family metal-binding regulatory protein [Xylella fastidiosa subsp. morus]|uniref:CopL family metal-binding regulatory protein n=1 Tax=Xylella fastidiosa TaxID=2371 RepID=UPI0003ECE0BC|nr:CopL family metal-binding regulatory protein [Xylella fastidiosa]EWG13910.1 hypothetical protein P910_002834 [Xylella fastidiosa Mul-MD]MDD0929370.1 CopL family metal-binding regulatory protein [Xylella fastidiosa subsp. multiplex]AIC14104.1 hypothetical protein P303_11415 [Xylella fastidiosa MUL0034]MDD0942736.1 CopL family metal-binding regulatory protein [Xylella fastidiosa subsp. multiplex]QTX28062.1 CopL family metal-binding regulatory protein [Xylella fastidiosa subsp. multiplex]
MPLRWQHRLIEQEPRVLGIATWHTCKNALSVASAGINLGVSSPYTDATSRLRCTPLPSLLLRLLISLCLIAQQSVSAWASVTMPPRIALPSMPVAVVDRPCHHTGVSGVQSAAHLSHAIPTPSTPCTKIGHCDCLQHSNALPVTLLILPVVLLERMPPLAGILTSQGLPAPYRPMRPPIA